MTDFRARFRPRSKADAAALVDAHPLAWIVSSDRRASVLPLLAERDGEGTLISLIGHYALRNPQVASLRADSQALILVQGPHGYVPPRLVSQPRWGPTWNYAVLRIEATIAFEPEETDPALRRLTGHLEPDGAWRVEEMGDRYAPMTRAVIAFRATITALEATFKLGQDENDATFAEIVAGHADPALSALMQAQRPPA